jgi:hypothetical protein
MHNCIRLTVVVGDAAQQQWVSHTRACTPPAVCLLCHYGCACVTDLNTNMVALTQMILTD